MGAAGEDGFVDVEPNAGVAFTPPKLNDVGVVPGFAANDPKPPVETVEVEGDASVEPDGLKENGEALLVPTVADWPNAGALDANDPSGTVFGESVAIAASAPAEGMAAVHMPA